MPDMRVPRETRLREGSGVKTFRFLRRVLTGVALGAIALPVAAAASGMGLDVAVGAAGGGILAAATAKK